MDRLSNPYAPRGVRLWYLCALRLPNLPSTRSGGVPESAATGKPARSLSIRLSFALSRGDSRTL